MIDNFSFILLNIYAPNRIFDRNKFWVLMNNYRENFQLKPWLIGGDFDISLLMEDKMGGKINLTRSMLDLRELLNDTKMIDLHLKGSKFTSYNR